MSKDEELKQQQDEAETPSTEASAEASAQKSNSATSDFSKEDTATQEAATEKNIQEETSPEEEIAGLSAQVESLQQELDAAKEQALRAAAEAQNVRRRAELDVEKAHKFALEKFARELLPVADSLEKASETLGEVEESQKEGVEMTLKLFMNVLKKFNIEQLNPMGEIFNPQFHEAMSMVPNPELPPNAVMDVLQKGYTLNERLLRPAMVVVATGGSAKKIDETA